MTESEAIKHLKTHIEYLKHNWKPHPDYNVLESIEMAINALEKQVPKNGEDKIVTNPIIDENGAYVDADIFIYTLCPICGNQVGFDEEIDNYCSSCGQKVKGCE